MKPESPWTSRVKEPVPLHHDKQSFHHAHASLRVTGHLIKEAGILAPLVISEFVDDFKKQRRWIRMASVATAVVSQGFYTYHVHQEREEAKARQEERCRA